MGRFQLQDPRSLEHTVYGSISPAGSNPFAFYYELFGL